MPLTSFRLSRTAPCPTVLSAKDRCARSSTAWALSSRDRASTAPTPGTPREVLFRPLPRHLPHLRLRRPFLRRPRADSWVPVAPGFPHGSTFRHSSTFPHSPTFPHSSVRPCHGPWCPVSVAACQQPRTLPKATVQHRLASVQPGLHRFHAIACWGPPPRPTPAVFRVSPPKAAATRVLPRDSTSTAPSLAG